jgi:hypothetical protein
MIPRVISQRARRAAYALLSIFIALYSRIRESWAQCTARVAQAVAVIPGFGGRHRRGGSGSQPKPPSVLGVVMTEKFAGNQHIQAIARILTW